MEIKNDRQKKISFVIPALNEAESLPELIGGFAAEPCNAAERYEDKLCILRAVTVEQSGIPSAEGGHPAEGD